MRDDVDHYELLGVSPQASDAEIRAAYRRAAKRWHPDANDHAEAHRRMRALNEAYRVLSDPQLRRDYDRQRPSAPGGQGAHPSGPGGRGTGPPPVPRLVPDRVVLDDLPPHQLREFTVAVHNDGGPSQQLRVDPELCGLVRLTGAQQPPHGDALVELTFEVDLQQLPDDVPEQARPVGGAWVDAVVRICLDEADAGLLICARQRPLPVWAAA